MDVAAMAKCQELFIGPLADEFHVDGLAVSWASKWFWHFKISGGKGA
jgi:hypothetical protein